VITHWYILGVRVMDTRCALSQVARSAARRIVIRTTRFESVGSYACRVINLRNEIGTSRYKQSTRTNSDYRPTIKRIDLFTCGRKRRFETMNYCYVQAIIVSPATLSVSNISRVVLLIFAIKRNCILKRKSPRPDSTQIIAGAGDLNVTENRIIYQLFINNTCTSWNLYVSVSIHRVSINHCLY